RFMVLVYSRMREQSDLDDAEDATGCTIPLHVHMWPCSQPIEPSDGDENHQPHRRFCTICHGCFDCDEIARRAELKGTPLGHVLLAALLALLSVLGCDP